VIGGTRPVSVAWTGEALAMVFCERETGLVRERERLCFNLRFSLAYAFVSGLNLRRCVVVVQQEQDQDARLNEFLRLQRPFAAPRFSNV
jgi:hypothetical protein